MVNLTSAGFGSEGGGWQNRPDSFQGEEGGWQNSPEVSHGQGSIESSNLANFIGEGHGEILGSSPTEAKAAKVYHGVVHKRSLQLEVGGGCRQTRWRGEIIIFSQFLMSLRKRSFGNLKIFRFLEKSETHEPMYEYFDLTLLLVRHF